MQKVPPPLKTRAQVRQEFARQGLSLASWAKANGYSSNMVTAIVNDDESNLRYKCHRGDAHNIAVALRLKEGEVTRSSNTAAFRAMATA